MIEVRQQILDVASAKFPERFVRKAPGPSPLPDAVWINPPAGERPAAERNSLIKSLHWLIGVDNFRDHGNGWCHTCFRQHVVEILVVLDRLIPPRLL